MASMAISAPFGFVAASLTSVSPSPSSCRNLLKFAPSASLDRRGLHGRIRGLSLKLNEQTQHHSTLRYDAAIEAKKGNPPIMPAVMTPGGPLDLSSVLFRNRIIFIGQPISSQVAQRVISQLLTLASIDEDADILVYLNCPGGSTYSVLAIYDCMSWIKPKVGTVCFGVAASQGALLLAGGEKGMRYAMPNARIMIHQPQSGCGGHVEDVRRQVQEAVQSRHKIDKMYAAFTGQPLETVQQYTERDRFFSSSEALEFGLIDGLLETEY
ncbi:ATP-dependent Clp protease proteolytic subunit 6, chloroplastic isoform X2 [Phoenix dactylifera]|uniref:ATP-dependent Clp protease proteolytic subunit n=1 Tax=Phoenix dactylifera TaxID=42345 RepID=A0A8B7C2K3_PHODC|nr:ATP-dependent Clp protease proteolytic subunit 6, chloroplastic isoform X2 [Phoenix dactylifera]